MTMTPAERDNYVRSRIAGRVLAVYLFENWVGDIQLLGPVGQAAFWEHVAELASKSIAALHPAEGLEIDGDTEQPMNDSQARKFGRNALRYGPHENRRIDEVPLSYLVSIVDDSEFKKKLRRYLASPRIEAELEAV